MKKRLRYLFTLAALIAGTSIAEAQQQAKVYRIGILLPSTASATASRLEGFRQGLKELGYEEGRNFVLERRYGESKIDRLPELASELVRLRVDPIVTATDPAIRAVKQATQTIPIVMATSVDPVGTGFVETLARPGGNITGVTLMAPELGTKRLELLKEAVPRLSRVAVLWNPDVPGSALELKEMEGAARSLQVQLQPLELRDPSQFESVFKSIKSKRADALITFPNNPVLLPNRKQIADLAAKNRRPAMYPSGDFVDAGGLMAYGPNSVDLYRRAATYVDKILKGRKPADLPVEQPTKFELVINLKAAKQIGLTIPPNVLARADKVIR